MLLLPLNDFESFMFRMERRKSPSYRVIKNQVGNLGGGRQPRRVEDHEVGMWGVESTDEAT